MSNDNKPLYSQIMDYLKQKIVNNEVLPGQQLATEKELAEQFGVSRITSKRALEELERAGLIYRKRGCGSFVSPDIFEEKSNVNQTAAIPMGSSKIISIVLPFEASKGGLLNCIKGATDLLNARGYFLSIHNTGKNVEKEKTILSSLVKKRVEGIIYYPLSDKNNYELLHSLYINDFPIVTIDKYFESIPISYVVSDNFSGGYKATSYLIERGHKRIAYISSAGIEIATSIRNRYFGYCHALKDNGILTDSEIILLDFAEDTKRRDYELYEIIKNNYPIKKASHKNYFKTMIYDLIQKGVTAIHTNNDNTAIYLLKSCIENGIKVPEDLSIVGFDNIDNSEHLEVPLSTIEQDFYKIGEMAAQIIIGAIEQNKHESTKITLPVKLIERQSSCFAMDKSVTTEAKANNR